MKVDRQKLYDAIKAVCEAMKLVMQETMASDLGINRHEKVMKNTLIDSHIYTEISIDYSDIKFAKILANDYIKYIESGRKKLSPPPPVEVIAEWAAEKLGISDNEIVEKIRWSIYWNGIKARPLVDVDSGFWDSVENVWDDWFKGVYDVLYASIDEEFNNNLSNK